MRWTVALLSVFVGVAVLTVGAAGGADSIWQADVLDEHAYFWSWNPANAVYRDGGSFHIAYAGDKVYLALTGFDGANLFTLDDENGASGSIAIARNASGNDLVAYVSRGEARLAEFDGFTSEIHVVDEGPGIGGDIALGVNTGGTHVVTYNETTDRLYYRFASGAGLNFAPPVLAAITSVSSHRMFFDAADEPVVALVDGSGLRVASFAGDRSTHPSPSTRPSKILRRLTRSAIRPSASIWLTSTALTSSTRGTTAEAGTSRGGPPSLRRGPWTSPSDRGRG
ncbi:MAG: hypothetical protein M5R36_19920 [Deltaproteobacteria bacterium]|nr:hypothetical protein [Deltaproteobacteria bacterium]